MSAETTASVDGSESLSSRLLGVLRPKSRVDHDVIPADAIERAQALFDRLAEEQGNRGVEVYNALDKLGRSWEIQAITDTDGSLSPTHYALTRRQPSGGRFNRKGSGFITAESFSIYPKFVFYLDLSPARITYNPINSENTLVAAEKTVASLFPVSAETEVELTPANEVPAVTNG